MPCIEILKNIEEYGITVWPYIVKFLSSPLFIALLAAWLAAFLGIKQYMKQQRIARVQKIYYEESLLDQLNHLDASINNANQSYFLFLTAMNILRNNIPNGIDALTRNSLTNLANQITTVPSYLSSKREVLIILFGRYGYIMHQWLFKYDRDMNEFNSFIQEIIMTIRTRTQITNIQLQNQIREVELNFELLQWTCPC